MKKKTIHKSFLGNCRRIIEKFIPETSYLYKWLYLNMTVVNSRKRNKRKESLVFKYHTVDGCNLNCIGCSTFSQLVNNSFVELSSFERDIKRIVSLGNVEKMEFIGGEALLHPNILELFKIAREYIKTGKLVLVTNGVLLSKQDINFWEVCKKNRIEIAVTPYPIKLDYDRIGEMTEKYEVSFRHYHIGKKDLFVKTPMNINGRANMSKSFKKCLSSDCATLRDGKMYPCYRPYCVKFFNEYFGQDFKVSERDYKDIYKVKDIDELLDFVCKPPPFCRYCDLDKMDFGIPWRQTKREISEWM